VPERRPLKPKTPIRRASKTSAPLIRIVVADHHAIDRGGVVGLLENESDFIVVGEAATLDDVVVQCRALKPDVLVFTMNLPSQEAGAAVPYLRQQIPGIKILAMSDRGTHNCMVLNPPTRSRGTEQPVAFCEVGTDCLALAAAQGARATLRRNADPEDLFRGIRAVAAGQSWYDPQTTSGIVPVGEIGGAPGRGSGEPLSERELDVAALLAEGLSNKEISTALDISEPTVKKHVGHILDKLGLQDRLQAGLYIARNPLVISKPENAGSGIEARRISAAMAGRVRKLRYPSPSRRA
jgi:DNA-binding NarL/FixJ family response regulator